MVILIVKVLLAIFAFLTAIVSIFDKKTFIENYSSESKFWRRLSGWGVLKISLATITLILVGINEYTSYQNAADSNERSKKTQADLEASIKAGNSKLEQARNALGATLLSLRSLSTRNDYIIKSLDGLQTRFGSLRISASSFEDIYTQLSIEGQGPYVPRAGDVLEWRFICPINISPSENMQIIQACQQNLYGNLTANSEKIQLNTTSGRATYLGTRSTGGRMRYASPAETESCLPMARLLASNGCELRIEVMREARWKFIEQQQLGTNNLDSDQAVDDACRRYEALYGTSCRDIIAPR